MPRKPTNELDNTEKEKKSTAKTTSVKKEPVKKSTATKKEPKTATAKTTKSVAKTTATKKTTKAAAPKTEKATKSTKTSKTAEASKSTKSTKTAGTKKATKTAKTTKSTGTAKVAKSTKSATKTTRTTRKSKEVKAEEITSTTDLTKKIEVLEYYDLPYRYNQTIVKVLAQTPTTLFIYWDISDSDRANFVNQYGENFFNTTKPVLIIHNNTMNYSFEVEIDDFANSWYLHVNDSNCEYTVELGRRPKNNEEHVNFPDNYLHVTSSNVIDSPNDHVLFDKNLKTVYFRDVKTNIVTAKDITSISFLRNMGRIYDLYDLQNDFTKNDWINNNLQLDLKNPSSGSSLIFK